MNEPSHMSAAACDVPSGSRLGRALIAGAWFRDSYRSPLSRADASLTDIFRGIFTHPPQWLTWTLIVRNFLASLCGLDAPTASEILNVTIKDHYAVGEKIGVWPIFVLADDEIIAGRNNKHMDFRLSLMRVKDGEAASVVVSTICTVHNLAGKIYLFFIVPFHRYSVRKLMSNAVAAGRL